VTVAGYGVPDDRSPDDRSPVPDRLIGTPERASAYQALEEHLVEKRFDPAEHQRRLEATNLARTQSELLQIFADLPPPHPKLPPEAAPPVAAPDDEPPAVFFAGCLTLGLGLPVAVVLGFAYGIWWSLAVPVAVTVAMAYIEHLRTPRPPRQDEA
jgi:hypothetical protein